MYGVWKGGRKMSWLDIALRRAAEHFFGPMFEWRFTRWLISRRGGDPADYEGIGKWERRP